MAQTFQSLQFNNPTTKKKKKSRKERKKEALEARASGVEAEVKVKGKVSKNTPWNNLPLKDKIQNTLSGRGKWGVNTNGTPMWAIYGTGAEGAAKAKEKLAKITDKEKAKAERVEKRDTRNKEASDNRLRQESLKK